MGVARFHTFFRDYNGRYAGDLLVLFMTRVGVLAPILESATIVLTLYLVLDLTRNRSLFAYLATSVLFFAMPKGVWRESIVWVSGFSNYAVGLVCVLIFLRATRWDFERVEPVRFRAARLVLIVLFGFGSVLFIENVSIYLFVAGVVLTFWRRHRTGTFSAYSVAWAVSFLIGLVVMFSNGAYRVAATTDNGYQRINSGHTAGITGKFHKFFDVIGNLAFAQNVALNATLLLLICLLAASRTRGAGRGRLIVAVTLAAVSTIVTSTLAMAEQNVAVARMWRDLAGVGWLFMLAALVLTASTFAVWDRRLEVYAACGSVLFLAAPFVLVDPVGPRCFYATYMFFILIAGLLLRELTDGREVAVTRWLSPVAATLALAALSTYFVIYGLIAMRVNERLDYLRQQLALGATIIRVQPLPFPDYVHGGDPEPVVTECRFQRFYRLPTDFTIRIARPGQATKVAFGPTTAPGSLSPECAR